MENRLRTYLLGWVLGLTLGVNTMNIVYQFSRRTIPKSNVEQGYAQPSKLEIKVKDIDQKGKKETLLVYDGKSYLLRLDEKGKPKIMEYEIKPIEMITKY